MQLHENDEGPAPDFRGLFESSPGRQLALTPAELIIVAASDAFLGATRTAREQVIGRRLVDLFSPDAGPTGAPASRWGARLRASIDRVLATRAADVMEVHGYDTAWRGAGADAGDAADIDGGREWIAVNSPVLDQRGDVVLIIHALEDVTESLRAQQELATAQAARDEARRTSAIKTRFLGMVSHELRTPLTALSLQVERMQRNGSDLDQRHLESLERIAFSAARLREMVETLLEYARIEGGRVSVNLTRFDLCESVRKTVAQHRHEAEERGLEMRCALPSSPALVQTDQRLVDLVISNLVDNSIKFTPEGRIDVTLEQLPDGECRVAVTDTGPGITSFDQQRIFEPFEQLGPGHRPLSGIGLGLALVRDIAGALGGRIELLSEPNAGSKFTFVLPGAVANGLRSPREPAKD